MKQNVLMIAAAVLLLAACTSNTTHLVGKFPPDSMAAEAQIIMGNERDTTVAVINGTFKLDLPVDVTRRCEAYADNQYIMFALDGSTITLDFEEGKAISSDKKGVTSRMYAFLDWMNDFAEQANKELGETPEEERNACVDRLIDQYNQYLIKTARENKGNTLGLMAITSLEMEDDDQIVELLNSMDQELKETEEVQKLLEAYEKASKTNEGQLFTDFTIVQDPENPEESTVHFSDYVGQGKYVLVDFWASWCGPCRREMPNLRAVYDEFHGEQFDMLSVAVWDKPEATLVTAQEEQIVWNQIINAQQIPTDLYGIKGIPHIILFGPDGTILKRNLRGDDIRAAVAEALGK